MAVTKQQKQEILAVLTARFTAAQSIGFAKTNTLTVSEFEGMRNDLRAVGANYMVAKKTLIVKAIKDALDIDMDLKTLPGQIGVVCSNEDAMAGLGKVNDLVSKFKGEKIQWAAAIFEGELKSLEETKAIAGMPSRDTLLGRLVGSMQSPIAGLARWFDAAAKELESTGKENVGSLDAGTPAVSEAKAEEADPEVKEEVKSEEAPAAEEKKEEAA
jgi:large subunit ribosomal protein L10